MEVENNQYNDLLTHHQRDINCIIDEDRNLRKRGLQNLYNDLFKKKQDTSAVLQIFQQNLVKNLMRAFEDKIEKNREIAYQIMNDLFAKYIPGNEDKIDRDIIIGLLRLFGSRLNQIPFPESSEEIRLRIIELLRKILKHYQDLFLPVLADICLALSKALQDQYPNLKKETCTLLQEMSTALSKNLGHHNSSIVKALGGNLKHQHSRIRKTTLEALQAVLLTQQGGSSIEYVMPYLQKIVFDQNNDVRKCTFITLGKLLTGFSVGNLKQYESDLLMLLLNGLSDDIPEIVQETQQILEDVGLKRKILCIENEEKIDEYL